MKKIYYLGLLLLISTASVKAQVTIGKDSVPHEDALLDLQQPNATTKKGLKLPVVSLSDANQYGLSSGKGATAVGMVVYNDNPSIENGNGVGLYVWNGSKWSSFGGDVSGGDVSECPSTVKDSENISYKASSFGSAGCWMTENLRSTKNDVMVAGTITLTDAPRPDDDYTAKVATYPNEISGNAASMGLLYTWAAATNRTSSAEEGYGQTATPQTQGICPAGWHIPSDTEWTDLEKVIAASDAGVYSEAAKTPWNDSYYTSTSYRPSSGNGHGSKMKSLNKVNGQVTNGVSNAASAGGFDGLLVGYVSTNGTAISFGTATNYWSSSSNNSSSAWYRYLGSSYIGVLRSYGTKSYPFSVRCKKN